MLGPSQFGLAYVENYVANQTHRSATVYIRNTRRTILHLAAIDVDVNKILTCSVQSIEGD